MACLVNDFASFDTPEDPGGASIVERKDFQAKRPLCLSNSAISALPYENQGTNMFSQHARDLANCLLY